MKTSQEYNIEFNKLPLDYQHEIIDFAMRLQKIINNYAITNEELILISKDVADFVTQTRLTNLRNILFIEEGRYSRPRTPYIMREFDKKFIEKWK